MRPAERDRREAQRLAALSRRAADLGAMRGAPPEVEEKALVDAELKLNMRCGGCKKRIGVGLVFSRFEVGTHEGRPIVNRMRMGACNGAGGCDFAAQCREGADLVEMVEYVWLTGEAPVAGGQLEVDVASAQQQLGVCPSCQTREGVNSPEPDLFVCEGCGAQWRGARMPDGPAAE